MLSQFLIDASPDLASYSVERLRPGFAADDLAVEWKLKGERTVSVFLPDRDSNVLVNERKHSDEDIQFEVLHWRPPE